MDVVKELQGINWLITLAATCLLSFIVSVAGNLATPKVAGVWARGSQARDRWRIAKLRKRLAAAERFRADPGSLTQALLRLVIDMIRGSLVAVLGMLLTIGANLPGSGETLRTLSNVFAVMAGLATGYVFGMASNWYEILADVRNLEEVRPKIEAQIAGLEKVN